VKQLGQQEAGGCQELLSTHMKNENLWLLALGRSEKNSYADAAMTN
jgi:hypothetical protein